MKYLINCSILVALTAFAGVQYGPLIHRASAGTKSVTGVVVSVIDGDSIKLQGDSRVYEVDLLGIDAPELYQNFGSHASNYLSDLINRRSVTVEMTSPDRDGVVTGEIFLNGVSINKLLLKDGFAWALRGKLGNRTWVGLEKSARDGGFGLWRYDSPAAPWEFRTQMLAGAGQAY